MTKKSKKIFKIVSGTIIFLTLPSLLFFCFLFFRYNEDLPMGIKGKKADALAYQMLDALDFEAYKNTHYIKWTFKKKHHYSWDKKNNICDVYWKDYKVALNLNDPSKSKVFIHSFRNESDMALDLIEKALKYFNNDSFWLIAPYKVFDKGVERQLVKTEDNKEALLVTYTSGGSTPGDSYLWHFDDKGKPISFQMWVSILPIGGLEATWSDWKITKTSAQLPSFHKLMVFGLEIDGIEASN